MNIEVQKKFQNFRNFISPFFEEKSNIEISDLTIESLKTTDEKEKTLIQEKIKKIQNQNSLLKGLPDQVFVGLVMTYIQNGKGHESFVKFVQQDMEDIEDEEKFFEFIKICCLIIETQKDESQKVIEKIEKELANIDKEKTPTAYEDLKKKLDLNFIAQERKSAVIALCNRPKEYFSWSKQEKNKFLRYIKYFFDISKK